ncbi:MAG: endolytic transglycosylase MltG [Anaerolineaceae bacterium]
MKRSERLRNSKGAAKGPIFGLVLLFLIFCLAVIGVGAAWGLERITKEAEQKFGETGPGLSTYDRINYTYQVLAAEDNLLIPPDPGGGQVNFTIESGDSPAIVAQKLHQAGLLTDQTSFWAFLVYSGLDSHLQAGDYLLSPSANAVETARKISDANQTTLKFGFLAGMRAEEIGSLLEKSGLPVDAGQFLSWVHHPPPEIISAGLEGITTLEGFLFPDVYELDRSTSTHALLQTMLANFEAHLTPEMRQAYANHGLSLQQAVILAAMVQKEAVVEEEQPLIASVFLNRIEAGMKFESDPTVQYAIGYDPETNTWWKNPLTLEDLKIDSPYNSYLYSGFPTGPISNPGLPALQAVAFPAETPYYYFRARCDGSGRHTFANSLDEHIQNACP